MSDQQNEYYQSVKGPFSLDNEAEYSCWRDAKLASYPRTVDELLISIGVLAAPSQNEHAAVLDLCKRANMAVYQTGAVGRDAEAVRPALRALGAAFGLRAAEDHRSAEADGIVAIEVASAGGRLGYIPYTTRPISWHTDGYYNFHGPENCIPAMVLHCVRDAAEGGVSTLLDSDIAYIRLRDRDPALIAALMHPEAMTIPPGEEAGGRPRPANTGPVFYVAPQSGALGMRYTARKRNIEWRDDAATTRARAALEEVLADDPLILRHKLQPGQGVICNNVLHTRTAFADGEGAGRLLYRVRYHERIA
ncbi:MAG: TauD/TfdA family dioxygenase [Alphaproteobacteria bacterium]